MARQPVSYHAVIAAPFGRLGVRITAGRLTSVAFLSARAPLVRARDAFTRRVCRELRTYFANPRHRLRLPLQLEGSEHQRRVWRALGRIATGEVRSYGELARQLCSSPRAVGGACRTNPVPIVVPCHRVVGASGLGGFMGRRGGRALQIKRWLLAHERQQ